MEQDKIYLGDCLELIKQIPDKSIDLIVTDPPYLIESDGGGGCFGSGKRAFHNEISDLKAGIKNEFLDEMVRVCKNPNMYLFCSKDQLPQYLNYAIDHKLRWDLLVWHKTNPVPTCNNKYLSDTEYIVFFHKGAKVGGDYSTKKKYWVTDVNKKDKDLWKHPTIKPIQIVKTLIINSSEVGGAILDPFIGSGTTAVACIQSKRHFIGFEIDEGYYKNACNRVKLEKAQLSLFE